DAVYFGFWKRNILARRFAAVVVVGGGAQSPSGISRERHLHLRQTNAGDIVTIRIRFGNEAWINRTVRRVVLIGRRKQRRVDCWNARLIEIRTVVEQVPGCLEPVYVMPGMRGNPVE